MAIFVTSDDHFNHLNILKYEPESRPFATVEEMNKTLIDNWNSCVKDTDTVFVLGDLCMGRIEDAEPLIRQLKGHIVLVRGNHDTTKRRELYEQCGIEIHDIYYLPYKGRFFIMCHFPIANDEFKRMVNEDNSEVIMLYGHVHSKAPKGYVDGTFHVGVDTNDLKPVSIEEIWQQSWTDKMLDDPTIVEYKNNHDNGANHECEV